VGLMCTMRVGTWARPMPFLARRHAGLAGLCGMASVPPSHDRPHASTSARYTTDDVIGWLRAERAEDLRLLSVSHLLCGNVGESFVFATGISKVHMLRVAKGVAYELKHRGVTVITSDFPRGEPPAVEGSQADDWAVVDGGSVVVSVMTQAARDTLGLEAHWLEQGAQELPLPPDPEEGATRESRADAFGFGREFVDPTQIAADVATGTTRPHWASADADEPLEDIYREDNLGDLDDVPDEDEAAVASLRDGSERFEMVKDDHEDVDVDEHDDIAEGYDYYEYEYEYADGEGRHEDAEYYYDGEEDAYYYGEEDAYYEDETPNPPAPPRRGK